MSVYGYVRVSTQEQSYEYQKTQILHFSNDKQLGNVIFVEDIVSGAKDWKQRAIGSLVDKMQTNDVLIVNEFSRLGRSLLDILEILKILKEKDVDVYIVRENMKLSDDLNSKVMVFMFSLVSEIERDLIRSRVKEGVANKRKDNPNWGRVKGKLYASKLDTKKDKIIELLSLDISYKAISKLLDINYQTLCSYIKSRNLNLVTKK